MKPFVQIVDDNDQVIGRKLRTDIDPAHDIYRVTALWLTNSRGEVLIAQRSLSKTIEPGKWGPAVSGTVEGDETYDQNIRKEVAEELGLSDIVLSPTHKERMTTPRNHFLQWYTAIVDRPADAFTVQAEEVVGVRWVPLDELVSDVVDHPDTYIPTMQTAITLFG